MSYSDSEAGRNDMDTGNPEEIGDHYQQEGNAPEQNHSSLFHRTAESLLALGTKVKDWYSNYSSQGYLPNVHIDE